MSAATHLSGRRAPKARSSAVRDGQPGTMLAAVLGERATAPTFASVVLRHVLRITPLVNRELADWRARADQIEDVELRQTARLTLAKRGNIEGASLFAVLAPARHRRATVRALVAFQTAYNFVDGLSELPSDDPISTARRLHQGLVEALRPEGSHPRHAEDAVHDDGGFLSEILDVCREALAELPAYQRFAAAAIEAASRIVDFQALNLGESQGGHGELRQWATDSVPSHSGLTWWETAAASGSSLPVHALIGASANPALQADDARRIAAVYFPWIGGLHSLLDSLVDRREDLEAGRPCLLDYYDSTPVAAARLASLAARGLDAAAGLPSRHSHRVIATAMCSYYLSAPQCATAEARAVESALTGVLGVPLRMAILMFRSKRLLHAITDSTYS